MRTLLALALSMASLSVAAAPRASKALSREQCPVKMPFALPDDRLSNDWGDMEWELWAASAWSAYCIGREASKACRCADAFGGGPY